MSDTGVKIKFDCNGFSAPAYSCSKAGDNSGVYVQSTDYDALVEQNKALMDALSKIAGIGSSCTSLVMEYPIAKKIADKALEQNK